MNAISRTVGIRGIRPYVLIQPIKFSLLNFLVSLLIALVITSAFGVVYFKDLNRRMFIVDQNLQEARQQYEVDWGKLLLEESAWSTQPRIQQIAESQLSMEIPKQNEMVVVEE